MKKLFLILSALLINMPIYAAYNDSYVESLTTKYGDPVIDNWIDVPTKSSTSLLGVNGVSISTSALVSGGTTFVNGAAGTSNQFTQITYPRNLAIVAYIPGATFTSLSGSCAIGGVNAKGITDTETVAVSTNPVYTSKAWSTVNVSSFSGFAINSTSSTIFLHLGTSNKIGLAGDIRNSSDVYKIVADGVDVSTCAKIGNCVSAKYDTMDLDKIVSPTSAVDYIIMYLKKKHYFGATDK